MFILFGTTAILLLNDVIPTVSDTERATFLAVPLNDCIDNQIELNWLKHNNDLVKMHNSKINYEF